MDCLQVGIDTLLRDIATDEVEPSLRIEDLVRFAEPFFILGRERSAEQGCIRHDVHRLGGGGHLRKDKCRQ